MSLMDLIRPELRDLKEYKPSQDNPSYRLHANESPWSPVKLQTLALNHYPNVNDQIALQEQLAIHYQVDSQSIALARGSDDGIDFLMRLFLSPGNDSILQCPPTFPMYMFYAQLQHAEVINCPLNPEKQFDLSIDELFTAWQPNCKLIFLCQPNNPTGNLITLENIAAICQRFSNKAMVVIDEAYIEFAACSSATTLLSQHENLVVLRTLSKAFGLAGLRLGCVIANPWVIKALQKIMAPYLLASPVMALAEQALQQPEWLTDSVHQILSERERVYGFLQQLPIIETIFPSEANFILVKTEHAKALTNWFKKHNLAVRDFLDTPLEQFLRISISDKATNQILMTLLQEFSEDVLIAT
ncbi:histidinol-phosphate transaminase [Legionella gresilensis]|uniref:histidinol-phosphate transaminase n=1 Tax=Legionella gresilensis TaxID=91823 RepID=UPI001040F38A|nr:histidinol-phosphate transaminase [Legionella gresilensis]